MEKLVHIVGNEEYCGLSSKEKEETIAVIMQFADDYMCTKLYKEYPIRGMYRKYCVGLFTKNAPFPLPLRATYESRDGGFVVYWRGINVNYLPVEFVNSFDPVYKERRIISTLLQYQSA